MIRRPPRSTRTAHSFPTRRSSDLDVIGKFLKKILYVGAFALILNSFPTLTDIIFRSFAGLGLTAGGSTIGPQDLLMPGRLAGTGFDAAWPLLVRSEEHTSELQSLMRISYAVFCLKKKKQHI